jgi:hypothetical protein
LRLANVVLCGRVLFAPVAGDVDAAGDPDVVVFRDVLQKFSECLGAARSAG